MRLVWIFAHRVVQGNPLDNQSLCYIFIKQSINPSNIRSDLDTFRSRNQTPDTCPRCIQYSTNNSRYHSTSPKTDIAHSREVVRKEVEDAITVAQKQMTRYHNKGHAEPDYSSGYAYTSHHWNRHLGLKTTLTRVWRTITKREFRDH